MLFVATSVDIGTVGTPLELFGTLEACCKLSFEERIGNEVIGTLPGIASNVAQIIGNARNTRLRSTLDLINGSRRRTNT